MYSYNPSIQKELIDTLTELKTSENDMYQHLFHDTQTAILVCDDKAKMANYSTAQLGNALRDVVLKSRRSYEPQVRGILGPLEERLSELIREDDRATLAGAQKIGHSLSDNQ